MRSRGSILGRRRVLALACLAVLAPFPALAVDGEDAVASIDVNASLRGCGLMNSQIVCTIDASWSEVEGADRYTAAVVAPDGTVTDAGEAGAGGTSIWVPYVGDGTYSVRVSAYGDPDEDGETQRVASGSSTGTTGPAGVRGGTGGAGSGVVEAPSDEAQPADPAEPGAEQPETTTPETTVPPETTIPPETTVPPETTTPEPVCTDPTPEQIAEREAIEAERQALIDEAREAGEPEPTFDPLPPLEPVCEPAG
ncbi:hypothetical protein HJD18_12655 [Thermoleophilia bacterium SCSIO 60948]|nr:hypothetical protein HJD18_12655 [Thermoleophilia bacterium SCSIO 60948]